MSLAPSKVIVTECRCDACSTHTVEIYHQDFPEMRLSGMSAEQAATHLAQSMSTSLDSVAEPSRREPVELAIADIRAFLDRDGNPHLAREL